VQSVTSAPESREEEQAKRIHRYLLTMGIRTACFVLAVVVDGWARWVFAAFAIVLPFFAVVLANGTTTPVGPTADDVRHLER
jgi:hypothetical protein